MSSILNRSKPLPKERHDMTETVKYDPDVHGDGYSTMVPMNVEPPEGHILQLWIGEERWHGESKRMSGRWFRRSDQTGFEWEEFDLEEYLNTPEYWTFAPAKPESPKSYVEFTGGSDEFDLGSENSGLALLSGKRLFLEKHKIPKDKGRSMALAHFIFDNLPVDCQRILLDTLNETEGER